MTRRRGIVAAGILLGGALLGGAAASAASCVGGAELPAFADKRIALAEDTLFFKVSALALDQDGSPEAYGVRDQGTELVCNGLAPLSPAECRGKNRGECFRACQAAFAAWSRAGADVDRLDDFMCSIGLGGGGCSSPRVRLQDPPRQAWFVSETSVRLSPPDGTPGTGWSGSQAAQIDAVRIPYFVIPGGFRRLPWDATPGDAGVIVDARSGRSVPFVVGDTGGALDEASTAVHARLRDSAAPPKTQRTSALGETVDSYRTGMNGDFRVAIFRHTSRRQAGSSLLSLKPDELGPWIDTTVESKLRTIGGLDRVLACAS